MPSRIIIFAAVALAVPASPSLAADPPARPAKELKICRGPEISLGSRIRKSARCRTIEQWRAEDEAKVNVPATLRVVGPERERSAFPK